ncbi:hotdog fold thioesterase [Janthinobacterium sp. HLX7-2]|uniref:hotdog fold thioesterase n=1 Tax=Janthinobacterium sp. HLX7-2 TaxID=1259331 RepID=UPI003F245C22
MEIWHAPLDLATLNAASEGTAMRHLGIEFTAFGADWIEARMPVDHRTMQPFRLLHGGASVLLAETLGSMAANACLDNRRQVSVGQEINANHLRGVRGGHVTGRTTPIHRGRSSQVWEIRIVDDEGKLCCISRITMAVIDAPGAG